jgi:hypothetical protein
MSDLTDSLTALIPGTLFVETQRGLDAAIRSQALAKGDERWQHTSVGAVAARTVFGGLMAAGDFVLGVMPWTTIADFLTQGKYSVLNYLNYAKEYDEHALPVAAVMIGAALYCKISGYHKSRDLRQEAEESIDQYLASVE